MRSRYFALLIPATLILLVWACGCSDDETVSPEPVVETYLHGVVVDDEGVPVEGVSIGLIYDLPGLVNSQGSFTVISRPMEKPMTGIEYGLPEPANVRAWITDYAGDLVITLVDDYLDAGVYTFMWSALDETESPVPSGMYYAHIQVDDEEPTVHDVFLLFLDPSDFLRHANTITNEHGEFRIPDSLIPVGESLDGIDETGTVVDTVTITDQLRVLAVREGATNTEWTELTISYLDDGRNGKLELVLP
jgi:hypothetical protein